MLNFKLSYADYSLLIQCLLSRMDTLSALMRSVADSNPNLYKFYCDEFEAVHALYVNARNI
jgi:hypothetical protein